MNEPDWARAISVLYERAPEVISKDIDESHPFITDGGLSKAQASKTLDSLEDWGLITDYPKVQSKAASGEVETTDMGCLLSKDGFEVAHERELAERNSSINFSLIVLTTFLVLSQIAAFLPVSDLGKTVLGGVILLALGVLIWREGLLDR